MDVFAHSCQYLIDHFTTSSDLFLVTFPWTSGPSSYVRFGPKVAQIKIKIG